MSSATISVTGEFVTNEARQLMLSGSPSGAWKLLTRGLQGDGVEGLASDILEGITKLVGTNELETVDEDQDDPEVKQYLKDLRYTYAGRIRVNGIWYRPSAKTRTGKKSAKYADDSFGSDFELSPNERRLWGKKAAKWFAGPGEIVLSTGHGFLLFEPCGERPFWWDELRDVDAAVKEYTSARGPLEVRKEDGPQEIPVYDRESTEEDRYQEYQRLCVEIANKVRDQAGDDTFELVVPACEKAEERRLTVPRAAFWNWALSRTCLRHLAPLWNPVSPFDMKASCDNRYHTDWLLGAGLNLSGDYLDRSVRDAAYEKMFRIQEEVGSFKAAVLVDHGHVWGKVGTEILVLPNLSKEYTEAALQPGVKGIVCETGGQLAHLSVVGLERGWTIMRVPDAVRLYPEGAQLGLDPEDGTIEAR